MIQQAINKFSLLLIIVATSILLSGCENIDVNINLPEKEFTAVDVVDKGIIATKEGTNEVKTSQPTLYRNENFDISLEIPTDWGEMSIVSENPEDPGPPEKEGIRIMVPTEKVTFTSKNNAKKSFVINIFDTTTFKDHMTFADGATGQKIIYDDGRYIVDLWTIGIPNLFPCKMFPGSYDDKVPPKDVCDEEFAILDQITNEIIPTFKMEKPSQATLIPSVEINEKPSDPFPEGLDENAEPLVFTIISEQFGEQIKENLARGDQFVVTKKRQLALPSDINDDQLAEFFEWGDLVLTLVRRKSMNVWLRAVPQNYNTTFSGILIADFEEGKWEKYLQIHDVSSTDKNNPYYLWSTDKTVFLSIVDQNGAGSGEGIMKLMTMNDGETWELDSCYYFGGNYNIPSEDGDYFEYSKKLNQHTELRLSYSTCHNITID